MIFGYTHQQYIRIQKYTIVYEKSLLLNFVRNEMLLFASFCNMYKNRKVKCNVWYVLKYTVWAFFITNFLLHFEVVQVLFWILCWSIANDYGGIVQLKFYTAKHYHFIVCLSCYYIIQYIYLTHIVWNIGDCPAVAFKCIDKCSESISKIKYSFTYTTSIGETF